MLRARLWSITGGRGGPDFGDRRPSPRPKRVLDRPRVPLGPRTNYARFHGTRPESQVNFSLYVGPRDVCRLITTSSRSSRSPLSPRLLGPPSPRLPYQRFAILFLPFIRPNPSGGYDVFFLSLPLAEPLKHVHIAVVP
jgi:hypothetical protein